MTEFLTRKPAVRRAGTAFATIASAALLLAACAQAEPDAAATEDASASSEPSSEATTPAEVDTSLDFGTILPQTGNLAILGPPQIAGVGLAVADLEAAGFEYDVSQSDRDSGDTTTEIATQAAQELIAEDVDVIIGAASSGVSMTFIDQVIAAEKLQISPANTSPEFTSYEDDGFYWRTAPSDVIQGRVLGNLMVANGAANVGIIYINDPYGQGLAENITTAVEGAGGSVTASVAYNPGDTVFTTQVSEVLATQPDAVAVIAFAETSSIIPELVTTQGFPASGVYFSDGNLTNDYSFAPGTLEGTWGTLPGSPATSEFQARLLEQDPALVNFSYGPEAYDAVVLSALAAAQGGSADPITIRDNLQSVSEGGTACTTIEECLPLVEAGTDIDYNGVSGPIEFDENGDPTEAFIGIYQYGADNLYTLVRAEEGSL